MWYTLQLLKEAVNLLFFYAMSDRIRLTAGALSLAGHGQVSRFLSLHHLLRGTYYFKLYYLSTTFCHLPVVRMTYQAVYLTGMTRRLHYPVVAVSC